MPASKPTLHAEKGDGTMSVEAMSSAAPSLLTLMVGCTGTALGASPEG
eukprot:CAMPEP_0177531572 /NCGR_PEP_ID=MMETSP0369-20130122/54105_1 /TAXON_ID=447022 ORGANISM="Scrippsiella hangoei-like, Strain SHHI-4" /NCGR_SAMPLE_ID=MMETSP0369 /ASSEMBLY_ACC=CAM_ASM_000364 /LENGTH=47 /DNA_ID= /DNA_START= /DNA_END= /DNA_ORIENTATION=